MYNIPIYYLDKIEKYGKASFTEFELQEILDAAFNDGFSAGYSDGTRSLEELEEGSCTSCFINEEEL